MLKSQREQQTDRRGGHAESDEAAADCQQNAFRESLHNDLPPGGSHGKAHGGLRAAGDGAGQPQTANRMSRLLLYCSFISATPAPAGTTLIDCLGRVRIRVEPTTDLSPP